MEKEDGLADYLQSFQHVHRGRSRSSWDGRPCCQSQYLCIRRGIL